jgi:integrase
VKFPKKLRHNGKGKVWATIYKRLDGSYRLYWRARVDGKPKSMMKDFPGYAAAKREGDKVVADLAKGKAAGLSPGQTADAQTAIEELQRYYVATGKRVSIRSVVSEWCENMRKLDGRSLDAAVDSFLVNAVKLKRKGLTEAIGDFIALDEARTVAKAGQRPELRADYVRQKKGMLLKLANMLPGHAVCDLTKAHVDKFFKELPKFPQQMKNAPAPNSAKSRNHHRGVLKQFFAWAVRNDYLPVNHRLLEAESMRAEKNGHGETEFYTPKELRTLLEAADNDLRPLIAVGGLAGLRTAELLRLDWADVWHVDGHIEVTAGKSKTRQRRLVEMVPALVAWLSPYRQLEGGKLWNLDESKFQDHFLALCNDVEMKRKANGLRHAFCTYHFALHANENSTAQQAGNSPTMIHAHYKGLATKAEAEKWFGIAPARPSNVVSLVREQRGER